MFEGEHNSRPMSASLDADIADPENGENLRKVQQSICCVDGFKTPDELINSLEMATNSGHSDVYLLGEYGVNMSGFLPVSKQIQDIAYKHKSQIVLAPDASIGDETGENKIVNWGEFRHLLAKFNIESEDSISDVSLINDSVGVFIDQDRMYAFPKTMRGSGLIKNPLHIIPGTRIGVTICGEIHDLDVVSQDKIKNVDVILNPAAESEDQVLLYRMMLKHGGYSIDQIFEFYQKRNCFIEPELRDSELRRVLEGYSYSEEFISELLAEPSETHEEWMARVSNQFNDLKNAILQQGCDSRYVKNVPGSIVKRVPIVRADRVSTGVLNEISSLSFNNFDFSDNGSYITRMDFSYSI